jgi:hypothetical protein
MALTLQRGARGESVKQAAGKTGELEAGSIVPRLFLDWCSIGPLLMGLSSSSASAVLRSRASHRHGADTEPVSGLDSAGSAAIHTNSPSSFSICQPESAAIECSACD